MLRHAGDIAEHEVLPLSYLRRFCYSPAFPTERHRAAAESLVDHLAPDDRVQAVLLTCSCARGRAVPESCVDIAVLVAASDLPAFRGDEARRIDAFIASDPACVALQKSVPWSGVDWDATAGEFQPGYHGWTSGADGYEIEIGNTLAWAHPLLLRGTRFEELQARYLPFYAEELRDSRLAMVLRYAHNNLEHVLPFARRELYFQALKRLSHALEEYLQALFIARRIYPIAYDKWVREQVGVVLGEPGIYAELEGILTVPEFSVAAFEQRAGRLKRLVDAIQV